MVGSNEAGVAFVMSLAISLRRYPTASRAAILAMGKPVAFDASAEDRETRGFISMITRRPVAGSTANCTLEPPVSTPTRRRARERVVAHGLVLDVGQRLRWCHGDGVTGVHTHRVEILDGAHHDAIVRTVSHHLELELLPAGDGLLDQNLSHRARSEAFGGEMGEGRGVVRDARPLPAEDEAGTDHDGKTDLGGDLLGLAQRVGETRARHLEADALHCGLELVAVFGGRDRPGTGADHLHTETLEHSELDQLHREVQRCLPAEGREQGVGTLLLDDPRQHLGVQRLDIGAVGRAGVGHDRRGVGVGQDDAVALLGQDAAGLRARVVELAGLADHDRAGPDDKDRFEVVAPRHRFCLSVSWLSESRRRLGRRRTATT